MKYIKKRQEPRIFSQWKMERLNKGKRTTYNNLHGKEKQAVKVSLMEEQGYLCCYCECRLTEDDSHIEHFFPQTYFSQLELEYDNLLCSCMKEREAGIPLHCGHRKDEWYDLNMPSPLDATTEKRFLIYGNGEIKPTDPGDVVVQMMIDKLGLNSRNLQDKRKKAIDGFLDSLLPDEDFVLAIKIHLRRKKDGTFNEFWSAISDQVRHPAMP
jgi:uncharacterized protein (TIGR02646 family)